MQTIWFPTPVVVLFRRLVNVVGTISISHHYLKPASDPADRSDAWTTLKSLSWLSWLARARFALAVDEGASSTQPQQRNSHPRQPAPPPRPQYTVNRPLDAIHRLMQSPLYDPIRVPRNPIALCHGLYGFDVRGPSSFPMLQKHYWSHVLDILKRKAGAEVIVTSVPGTGSIASRAKKLDGLLKERAPGRSINFLAHSMGGLDCRHLISHIKPTEYTPLSLTTIATPHRGSPFMDWCSDNLGLGKLDHTDSHFSSHPEDPSKRASTSKSEKSTSKPLVSLASLPSSFTTMLLGVFDSPAYANLSTTYLNKVFNPNTPDDPNVRYFSVAGRLSKMSIVHPLWLPKMVLDGYEEKERERIGERWRYEDGGERWGNDGLVTVQSARWGEFLGILEECDHWELRGARGLEIGELFGSRDGDTSTSESSWALGDWGRMIRAWKREEKKAEQQARAAGAEMSESRERERKAGTDKDRAQALDKSAKEKESGFADDVLQASTERVSAVFDWIVDQVPSPPSKPAPAGQSLSAALEAKQEAQKSSPPTKSELETKADLERFYVALCRKLYDEGL